MSILDKAALFKPLQAEEDYDIPGRGTIRIRAITRGEMHAMRGRSTGRQADPRQVEYKTIVAGVAEPALSYEDVVEWGNVAPGGEIQGVVEAILDLSGLSDEEDKRTYKQFRGKS